MPDSEIKDNKELDNEVRITTTFLGLKSILFTAILIFCCFFVGQRDFNMALFKIHLLLIGLGVLISSSCLSLGIKWSWKRTQDPDETPQLTKVLPGLALIIGGLFFLTVTISSTLLFTLGGFLAR